MKKLKMAALGVGAIFALHVTHGVQGVTGAVGHIASSGPVNGANLTGGQQQFGNRLAADTGLNPSVITAWLLCEESGGNAASRQAAGNNDWLNIGYTDSGTYGSSDGIWGSPVTAADASASWLKGTSSIPGFGAASSGVRSIAATAGQSPSAQIAAIQNSGWASSGYPDMPALYRSAA